MNESAASNKNVVEFRRGFEEYAEKVQDSPRPLDRPRAAPPGEVTADLLAAASGVSS